jgi:hypothetical protein
MNLSEGKMAQNKSEVKSLYVRKLQKDNYDFIKEESEKRGYCPSTFLNRILNFIKKNTNLEML